MPCAVQGSLNFLWTVYSKSKGLDLKAYGTVKDIYVELSLGKVFACWDWIPQTFQPETLMKAD